jgi:hypothetical protein
MIRGNTHILRRLLLITDLCFVALCFQILISFHPQQDLTLARQALLDSIMLVAVAVWGLMLWGNQDNYVFRGKQIYRVIKPTLSSSFKASAIFIIYFFCLDLTGISHGSMVLFFITSTAGLCIERAVLHVFLRFYRTKGYDHQNIIIVGNGHQALAFADHIFKNPQWGMRIPGFIEIGRNTKAPDGFILWSYKDIPCIGNLNDLPEILKSKEVDWVIFAAEKEDLGRIEESLLIAQQMGTKTAILADFFPQSKAKYQVFEFMGQPVLTYDMAPPANMALLFKSLFDRLAAAISLALFGPLTFAAALAIKISCGGSIFYKQERIGLNGRRFYMYKFRTMVPDADNLKEALLVKNEADGPAFKIKDDPRVTPIVEYCEKHRSMNCRSFLTF